MLSKKNHRENGDEEFLKIVVKQKSRLANRLFLFVML